MKEKLKNTSINLALKKSIKDYDNVIPMVLNLTQILDSNKYSGAFPPETKFRLNIERLLALIQKNIPTEETIQTINPSIRQLNHGTDPIGNELKKNKQDRNSGKV
uniref:Uncharacterized protein n=1 Tax=Cacopsylla melanoneura TaxID=428564 RepID=A0A8D8R9I4_9HEMI